MSAFYSAFMGEINAAKKHFDLLRRSPPGSPLLPKYAGAARWVTDAQQLLLLILRFSLGVPCGERAVHLKSHILRCTKPPELHLV